MSARSLNSTKDHCNNCSFWNIFQHPPPCPIPSWNALSCLIWNVLLSNLIHIGHGLHVYPSQKDFHCPALFYPTVKFTELVLGFTPLWNHLIVYVTLGLVMKHFVTLTANLNLFNTIFIAHKVVWPATCLLNCESIWNR